VTDDVTLPPQTLPDGDATVPPQSRPDSEATLPPSTASQQPTLGPALTEVRASDARAPAGYLIDKELGRGGMGVVYKARSVSLQRPCALKMILAGAHSGADEIERFKTEAQAIARLQHAGIVQVFEIGEHDGLPFMALEFCGGGSLDAILAKNPLQPRASALLVQKLAEAMYAAHEAKVIHRDLKPANVLLSDKNEPKITDFGLAKKLDEAGATRTGSVMGTPSYMPPEQANGAKDIGPAADIYALGAILYECLTGRPPFRAATPLDTIMQVVTEEPVPLRQLNAQAPVDLETIAHKCLQKEPHKRYLNGQELADDLGRFLNGEPILARPVGAFERAVKWVRRNAIVSALASATLFALTAGIIVSSYFAYAADQRADAEAQATRQAQAEKSRADEEAKAARKAEIEAEEQLRRSERLVYAGTVTLASSAFGEGAGATAQRHLRQCQWDLRGWEHRHLWTRCNSKQTFTGHAGSVQGVVYSPDGTRVCTSGEDRTVQVWDVQTGKLLLTLKGHIGSVVGLAYSPDGKHILSAAQDNTAILWDASKGTQLRSLRGHTGVVWSVAFSPDGERVATASWDKTARVWETQTGRHLATLTGHASQLWGIAFSPDGKRLVTGSGDASAKVWDADKGQELFVLKGHAMGINSVAWSPAGNRILTGSFDSTAKLWDAGTGKDVHTLKGHRMLVSGVAFSPDGTRAATASFDESARVWDVQTGQQLFSLSGHSSSIYAVAFAPDGRRLATVSTDGTARTWDAERGQELLSLHGYRDQVSSVAVSADGKLAVSGWLDGTVTVWDTEQGYVRSSFQAHTPGPTFVAFSPSADHILTGGADRLAKISDAATGRKLLTFQGHEGAVTGVAYSPDGKRAVTGSLDKTAKVWHAETGLELRSLRGHSSELRSVAYSPDGMRIATGGGVPGKSGEARVWDVESGRELLSLVQNSETTTSVVGLAFSPNSKRVVGIGPKPAQVWDTQTGQELLRLRSQSGGQCVAFSPDGKRIFTGGGSFGKPGELKAWDAESGEEVFSFKGHRFAVLCVAFSKDGKIAVSGGGEAGKPGELQVWEAANQLEAHSLRGQSGSVSRMAFSPEGKRLFAWDDRKSVMAWHTGTGNPAPTVDAPAMPQPGTARSADGALLAYSRGHEVVVVDSRLTDPKQNHWPLPARAERFRYHNGLAQRAATQREWFVVAFHVGRLLLDDTENVQLKNRRDEALRRHANAKTTQQ